MSKFFNWFSDTFLFFADTYYDNKHYLTWFIFGLQINIWQYRQPKDHHDQ